MRGRDAGALVTGRPDCRKGPCRKASGPQKRAARESLRTAKRAARESLRTAEKSRAGKPPDRKKGCAGKPPDRRRGRLTEAPAADRRGTHKDAQRQAAAARKKALSALPSDSVTRKSLTTERPERYVVPVFRVTFGLHSVVIQPRGQRPTSAMPRPSTPPAAPSTPLFPFPHPSTPFNAGPFGPAALHPPGRTARTGGPPPPSGLPAPDACRPPVTPQRLRLFSPCRSPRPFARHLRSLDAASSSPPQGKHPDFRSEARFFAH